MLVDAHAHVWRAVSNHPEPAVTTVSPVSDVPAEVLDEYLAEYGVGRAVLVQPVHPGEDNGSGQSHLGIHKGHYSCWPRPKNEDLTPETDQKVRIEEADGPFSPKNEGFCPPTTPPHL
jgi:hypothetical protein